MRVVSDYKELEGQTFASFRECADAEAAVDKLRQEKEKSNTVSKKKKQLADAVEEADKAVVSAYENYDKVKAEVRKILEESNARMSKMLQDATNSIKNAEKQKRDAILNYNREYGPYQKVYSGDKATEEFKIFNKKFNDSFDSILSAFLGL